VVTDPQTNKQTGPITIHCAAKLCAQCNNKTFIETRNDPKAVKCNYSEIQCAMSNKS